MTAQDITAIASVAIAVLAFLATIWQAGLSRDHNRKSTMPILTFHCNRTKGCRISIRNDGVGPALLKEFRYFVDGKQCDNADSFDQNLCVPDNLEYFRADVTFPASIGISHEIEVFLLCAGQAAEPALDVFCNRIGMQVVYKSVYGEQYETEIYTA